MEYFLVFHFTREIQFHLTVALKTSYLHVQAAPLYPFQDTCSQFYLLYTSFSCFSLSRSSLFSHEDHLSFFTWFPNWWGGLLLSLGVILKYHPVSLGSSSIRVFFHGPFSSRPKTDLLQSSSVIWFCPGPSSQDAEPLTLTVIAAKPAFNLLTNNVVCENKYVVS